MRSVDGVLISLTFPAIGHHCPVTGIKLYCLVTETHVCEQLAQGRYLTAEWLGNGRESMTS